MKVKIQKLHADAVVPSYSKEGDAGMDLTAVSGPHIKDGEFYVSYKTGLKIEIPKGFVGLLFPRSSISNYDLAVANSVGVVDSGYRGEIEMRFKIAQSPLGYAGATKLNGSTVKAYQKGDRIAQLIILAYPPIEFEQVEELSSTDRGTGGHGSTGL